MKNWILGLLLLMPLWVLADDVDLKWVPSPERENNKPITIEEYGGFRIHDSFDNSVLDIPNGSATSHKFVDVLVGEHTYKVQSYDTEGRNSDWSMTVLIPIFEEVILPPKSPELTATVTKTVY